MKNQFAKIVLSLASFLVLSCQTEEPDSQQHSETMVIQMSASVSGLQVASKALSSSDESQIDNIYVLVFNSSTQVLSYISQATNIINDDSKVSFSVSLSDSGSQGDSYFVVLLANISEEDIENAKLEEEQTSFEAAMERLTFTPSSQWQSTDRIPMWCQLPLSVAINRNTDGSDFGSGELLRSLARINITNLDTEKFALESASLYNSLNTARLAPASENISNNEAIYPTLPESYTTANSFSIEASDNHITNEFYVAEKCNSSDNDHLFLIIKGRYNDNNSSYYRIDICSDGQNLDILRNNTYQLNITDISGNGADSESQAADQTAINSGSSSSSSGVVLTVWNNSDLNYIFCDESTTLAVNALEIELYSNGNSSTFEVQTDNPSGYTASIDASCNWINNINYNSNTIYISPRTNNTGYERQTTMTIYSGEIACAITLVQGYNM